MNEPTNSSQDAASRQERIVRLLIAIRDHDVQHFMRIGSFLLPDGIRRQMQDEITAFTMDKEPITPFLDQSLGVDAMQRPMGFDQSFTGII